MKPDRWRNWLNEYLDGELDAACQRMVEAGLAGDPHATRLLDELRRTKAALASLPRRDAPADAASRRNGRVHAFLQQLLAAYADDQLPAHWRERVEAWLAEQPQIPRAQFNAALAAMRAVSERLGSLPRHPAPPDLLPGVLDRLKREAEEEPAINRRDGGRDAVRHRFELWLAAYADGELGPEEREWFEQKLKHSRRARQRLAAIQRISAGLRSLPRRPAPPGALAALALAPAELTVASASVRRPWRAALVAGLSLAAAIALVAIGGREWMTVSREMALVQPSATVQLTAAASAIEDKAGSDRFLRRRENQAPPVGPAPSLPVRSAREQLAEHEEAESVPAERGAGAGAGVDGLALEELARLPLDELGDLDHGTIRLWAQDPRRANERLWIVLADNEVTPVRDAATPALGAAADEAEGKSRTEADPGIVEVELSTARLANVLRDLASAERSQPLFASVEIHRPARSDAKDSPTSPAPAPAAAPAPAGATELVKSPTPKGTVLYRSEESFLRPSAAANLPGAGQAKQADGALPAATSAPPSQAQPAPVPDPSGAASAEKKAKAAAESRVGSLDSSTPRPHPPARVRLRFVLESEN